MQRPLLPSLTTMIGRSVVNAAFDLDLRSPRHSARKPLSELAPPTSTPNSVRCTARLDAAGDASASASSPDGADATTSGSGGATGSGSISFPAAKSGGAMIDFDAMSGVAGIAAGAFELPCPANGNAAGACCGTGASAGGRSAVAATVVATADAAGTAAGLCGAG